MDAEDPFEALKELAREFLRRRVAQNAAESSRRSRLEGEYSVEEKAEAVCQRLVSRFQAQTSDFRRRNLKDIINSVQFICSWRLLTYLEKELQLKRNSYLHASLPHQAVYQNTKYKDSTSTENFKASVKAIFTLIRNPDIKQFAHLLVQQVYPVLALSCIYLGAMENTSTQFKSQMKENFEFMEGFVPLKQVFSHMIPLVDMLKTVSRTNANSLVFIEVMIGELQSRFYFLIRSGNLSFGISSLLSLFVEKAGVIPDIVKHKVVQMIIESTSHNGIPSPEFLEQVLVQLREISKLDFIVASENAVKILTECFLHFMRRHSNAFSEFVWKPLIKIFSLDEEVTDLEFVKIWSAFSVFFLRQPIIVDILNEKLMADQLIRVCPILLRLYLFAENSKGLYLRSSIKDTFLGLFRLAKEPESLALACFSDVEYSYSFALGDDHGGVAKKFNSVGLNVLDEVSISDFFDGISSIDVTMPFRCVMFASEAINIHRFSLEKYFLLLKCLEEHFSKHAEELSSKKSLMKIVDMVLSALEKSLSSCNQTGSIRLIEISLSFLSGIVSILDPKSDVSKSLGSRLPEILDFLSQNCVVKDIKDASESLMVLFPKHSSKSNEYFKQNSLNFSQGSTSYQSFSKLVEDLKSPDPPVRGHAIHNLMINLRNNQDENEFHIGLDHLSVLVHDPDSFVYTLAIGALVDLSKIQPSAVIDVLKAKYTAQSLPDENRIKIAEAFSRIARSRESGNLTKELTEDMVDILLTCSMDDRNSVDIRASAFSSLSDVCIASVFGSGSIIIKILNHAESIILSSVFEEKVSSRLGRAAVFLWSSILQNERLGMLLLENNFDEVISNVEKVASVYKIIYSSHNTELANFAADVETAFEKVSENLVNLLSRIAKGKDNISKYLEDLPHWAKSVMQEKQNSRRIKILEVDHP